MAYRLHAEYYVEGSLSEARKVVVIALHESDVRRNFGTKEITVRKIQRGKPDLREQLCKILCISGFTSADLQHAAGLLRKLPADVLCLTEEVLFMKLSVLRESHVDVMAALRMDKIVVEIGGTVILRDLAVSFSGRSERIQIKITPHDVQAP